MQSRINGEVVGGRAQLSGVFGPGDRVQCQLTPLDGEGKGDTVDSDVVVIGE